MRVFQYRLQCPKCKSENLNDSGVVLTTYPPMLEYTCTDCGYRFTSTYHETWFEYEPIEQ